MLSARAINADSPTFCFKASRFVRGSFILFFSTTNRYQFTPERFNTLDLYHIIFYYGPISVINEKHKQTMHILICMVIFLSSQLTDK